MVGRPSYLLYSLHLAQLQLRACLVVRTKNVSLVCSHSTHHPCSTPHSPTLPSARLRHNRHSSHGFRLGKVNFLSKPLSADLFVSPGTNKHVA
ncbi:unnamed protein product [Protopolystoma xenopodis]|uniref:Uncharacterized protein n=1 Tax=Protopolystoma xenopodis TaxID=117903 RepID=A0A3S5B329_9PLAT|nr:unnamed protein product [Protopolystoma xenopodis]